MFNRVPTNPQYVAQIPKRFDQGDSVNWNDDSYTDVNLVTYTSTDYTLTYKIAGPAASALSVIATANGLGWSSAITSVQSAALNSGKYWWQAQLSNLTGTRITIDKGELIVDVDLASAGANYDGRTLAEKALDDAEKAYSNFAASSKGSVRAYTIGHRSMTFHSLLEVKQQVDYWRTRVTIEQSKARGSRDRLIKMRFDRAR